jgi:secreted PhoX family phosphatase
MRDSVSAGYSDGDVDTNTSDNPTLSSIVSERYSRRQTLFGGISATALAVFGTSILAGCGDDEEAPVVSAGANGSSSSGRVVTLNGSATTSETGALTTTWTQTSGPTVTLTGANTATATFLAPSVAASTDLKFTFSATDSNNKSTTAETTVTVTPAVLGFTAVPKHLDDIVSVPAGYTASVLYRLGDPLAAGVSSYANNGTDADFAQRAGDQHDAVHYFGLASSGNARDDNNSARGLLVMNHENIVPAYLHPNGATNTGGVRPEAEALKEIEAHGVSIVEVSQGANGAWAYSQASTLNRRITPNTPIAFSGPVRGNDLLKTLFSPDGTQGRGTINNCANGYTPWGTSLTCEENWAGYFKRPTATDNPARLAAGGLNPKSVISLTRYGVTTSGNYGWSTVTPAAGGTQFARWNAAMDAAAAADGTGDFRNEPNQFGWVVETDPYDPASIPRKRTALGRLGHEGCWPSKFVSGVKPAFYMGDDNRNDYLYKFVSAAAWTPSDATRADRLAVGDKYLDNGTLYVAKFNADGGGAWLPLVFGTGPLTAANATYPFADQADVLTNARLAADAVGATKMDRPEWTAVNPVTGEVYLTLTNTNAASRPLAATDAANPRHYNDPKGATNQFGNPNGHIIRLREAGDTSEAATFTWDIYAFGAGVDLDATNINISGLDATNDFSSPDGLWFGRRSNASGLVKPVLWIQTDDGAYTDVTNCMMLAAMPGSVGDGGTKTITNTDATGATATQTTRAGAAPGTSLRRFLVGPKQAEITGVDSTPDGRTLFVNIQHPGEEGNATAFGSNWPASQSGGTGRPRSATVVITKNDGGVVAL